MEAGVLRKIEPRLDSFGEVVPILTTFFGKPAVNDCGGGLYTGKADGDAVDEKVRASLALICPGQVVDVKSFGSCVTDNKITVMFQQVFTEFSHIVTVERACTGK